MGSQGNGFAVLIPPTGGSNVANIGRVGLSQNSALSGVVAYAGNIILPSIKLGKFLIHY